jgi:hypothetical protein
VKLLMFWWYFTNGTANGQIKNKQKFDLGLDQII